MEKLTAKQKRFCDEYLKDMNAKQAAIRAGYSEKTAHSIGNENLKKPELKKYITDRMKEKDANLIADQDEVLQHLTSVMRREKTENVVVTMRKQTIEKEVPKVVEIPAKLSDANKAAELLGKAHCLFTEKVDLDADMSLNIKVDYGDSE